MAGDQPTSASGGAAAQPGGAAGHGGDAGHAADDGNGAEAHGHASVLTYVVIGAVLTIITAVEVAIFYIEQLERFLAPILITLSASKFVIVVLFYMHLKYDSPVFRRVFFGPLMLAVLLMIALIILFKALPLFVS